MRSYEEFFAGYLEDPVQIRSRTFSEVDGYDEMIVMTDIRFESHCEHHMAPIIGKARRLLIWLRAKVSTGLFRCASGNE